MGDFRKKYIFILRTDFEGKKSLQGNSWGKNPTLIKISFMAYNAGGKNPTVVCQLKIFYQQRFGTKSYPNEITHPPSKVKWSAPNFFSN